MIDHSNTALKLALKQLAAVDGYLPWDMPLHGFGSYLHFEDLKLIAAWMLAAREEADWAFTTQPWNKRPKKRTILDVEVEEFSAPLAICDSPTVDSINVMLAGAIVRLSGRKLKLAYAFQKLCQAVLTNRGTSDIRCKPIWEHRQDRSGDDGDGWMPEAITLFIQPLINPKTKNL